MAAIDSNELENILINISEKYVSKIESLKDEQDKSYLKNINELLEKLQSSQTQLGTIQLHFYLLACSLINACSWYG